MSKQQAGQRCPQVCCAVSSRLPLELEAGLLCLYGAVGGAVGTGVGFIGIAAAQH